MPDHSVLTWRVLVVVYVNGSSHYTHDPVLKKTSETKYVYAACTSPAKLT